MKKKKAKVVWYIELSLCVILAVLYVGLFLFILQGHSCPPSSGAFRSRMLSQLSECGTAEKALRRLETGFDTEFGLYTMSECYPSTVEGVLFMVMIEAPSGASPQYSVLILHPAPKQSDMCFCKREANGSVKGKAFAVRYIDWNEDEQLPK